MAIMQVNPTRMELSRLKKKLSTARRGHKLLKDKRDELMRQFLGLVQETRKLRAEAEEAMVRANENFALAAAVMGQGAVETALMCPKMTVEVEVSRRNIMSVEVPEFRAVKRSEDVSDCFSYGFLETTSELDEAVASLADVFPKLLQLAQTEKACRLLAAEIEKTRRRVNALEHVLIPQYEETIKYISMKLDENERSTQIRLLKVKEMVLDDARKS